MIDYNNNDKYIDDDLQEKIERNKNVNTKKPLLSIIIVRLLGILSLGISLYYMYILYEPFTEALNDNLNVMLQILIYGVVVLLNIFAAINLIRLNNLGRILQFIVLFIFAALRVFDILYRNLNNEELNTAVWSIIIACVICLIIITKPISKAF
ncbi:MAG: hypothetical protein ACOCV8_03510 [Spirochaetota bacterium]